VYWLSGQRKLLGMQWQLRELFFLQKISVLRGSEFGASFFAEKGEHFTECSAENVK